MGVGAIVGGDELACLGGAALDMLAHGAASRGALVVAARVRVALHQLLPILAPSARQMPRNSASGQ